VTLAGDRRSLALSVVPIGRVGHDAPTAVLLLMGRRELCTQLSRERFAREQDLTLAESGVLSMPAEGQDPIEITAAHARALSASRSGDRRPPSGPARKVLAQGGRRRYVVATNGWIGRSRPKLDIGPWPGTHAVAQRP
jgi:hypothetical protein